MKTIYTYTCPHCYQSWEEISYAPPRRQGLLVAKRRGGRVIDKYKCPHCGRPHQALFVRPGVQMNDEELYDWAIERCGQPIFAATTADEEQPVGS